MNDNLGLISFNKKTFLLNYLGQFTEIKKDNKDINGQIKRMSDTMALFQDENDISYLLDIYDPLKPNWTELKLLITTLSYELSMVTINTILLLRKVILF